MRKEKILMGKEGEKRRERNTFFLFNDEDRFGRHHLLALGFRAISLSLEASRAAPNAIHL